MRILLLTTMIFFATSAIAGLYKWTDADGNVHYSQKRPPNQQFQKLKAPPTGPEADKPLYSTDNKISIKNKKRIVSQTKKNLQERSRRCTAARKNLGVYQIYRKVRNKDGSVTRLDDNQRAERIQESKDAISEYCD